MKKVSQIFGINPDFAAKLAQAGIRTIVDLANAIDLAGLSVRVKAPIELLSQWREFAKAEVAAAGHRRKILTGLAFIAVGMLAVIGIWSHRHGLSPKSDDAAAHYNRGLAFYKDHQFESALHEYQKALSLKPNYAEAMTNLGVLYDYGLGVPHDYQKARQWYEKAAAAGNAKAMYNLGILYYYGQGVLQDYEQARQWNEKAAVAGNTQAMLALGSSYEFGQGVPQDYEQARQWYEKAAAAGNAEAMIELGYFYVYGHGVVQNSQQARQWYEKGAAAGSAQAMLILGDFYASGHEVPHDYQKARQWYEKAAAAGSVQAMNDLGDFYASGHGVPQDSQKARQWYGKAVEAKRALDQLPEVPE